MTKVDQPNLLLDESVTWDFDVNLIPRHNSIPQNYQRFSFNDTARLSSLNLPVLVTAGHRKDLKVLGTGPYVIARANVTLTATRELELRKVL